MEEQQNNQEANTVTETNEPTSSKQPISKNKVKFNNGYFIPLVVLILIMAAGAVWFMSSSNKNENNPFDANSSANDQKEYPAIVAKVNGEEVPVSQLKESLFQAEQAARQQGLDPADPTIQAEIENQAYTIIVNTRLLVQAAESAGLSTTESEIDEQVGIIENQFGGPEALQAQLDTLQLSVDDLREDIAEQLIVDQYIKATAEWQTMEVTDEEVRAAYDNVASGGQELPAFDEVSAVIREQLEGQKQQEITLTVIERLRAEANIEKLF